MNYTYLIGWTKLDTWYYGVRFSEKAETTDLWNTYFTSSKYVKKFAEIHGTPDVIQIRKVFGTREKAVAWETKVLHRIDAQSSTKFLNKSNGGKNRFITFHSEETKSKLRGPKSESHKSNLKTAAKNRPPQTLETREKRSRSHIGKVYTEERLIAAKINRENFSAETRQKLGHGKGIPRTEEVKAKLRKPKGPHSTEHNKLKSDRQSGMAWAKMADTGMFLGRIPSTDPRWISKEIVGIRAKYPITIREPNDIPK